MYFLYKVLLVFAGFVLQIAALFSPKMKLFVDGRKNVIPRLRQKIGLTEKAIWFHAASLGEYEQGLPVMEAIKNLYPNHKIVLTFFSPSGYEVRKSNKVADVTVYLPLDTRTNVCQFLDAIHPEMVFFIKYEYWPNYLKELRKRKLDTYLISGIFRENQVFFKWYGGFYREALESFGHFFVQNQKSADLLRSIGKHNVTVSGDTRFDRVAAIVEKDNTLEFVENFKDGKLLVVIGSSWPKDETLLADYINQSSGLKFIFAPHNIKVEQIDNLKKSISKKVIIFTEMADQNPAESDVLIVDTIGMLTKIYSYADIAYVGGGFGNPGVHNLLEPATFGVPIVVGPNYSHFAEAVALVENGGCISVKNQNELSDAFDMLIQNQDVRYEKGHICRTFVQMNRRATEIILKHIAVRAD